MISPHAGALIVNDQKLADELAHYQNSVGGTPGPMDCLLVMRGIKTLPLRMDRHAENAMAIAKHLEATPRSTASSTPACPPTPSTNSANAK